ncbi:MAG: response regulator transcription factor [Gammaproteobacteria bacterium]
MRVLLIDDHEIFRLGLRTLLESEEGMEVVGEAGDGESGIALIAATRPDVVVLDYAMPGVSGLEILDRIKQQSPGVRVVMLTASRSEAVLSEALGSGADGVVLKKDASTELVQALETALDAEQTVSTGIAPLVQRQDALAQLTRRERQVLRMIVQGYRNREISEQLNVSLKTVDSHRTNLMRKLDIHNLVDLVAFANQAGLSDDSI